MATSRTGTTRWIKTRRLLIAEHKATGKPCPECLSPLEYDISLHKKSPEIDHIIPVSRGGTDDRKNLRVICRQCNQSLGGKLKTPRPKPMRPTISASPIW